MTKRAFFVLILLGTIFASCKKETNFVIASYGDGPYISSKRDSISALVRNKNGKFDSIPIEYSKVAKTSLICIFDSIHCPNLSFNLELPRKDQTRSSCIFPMPGRLLALSDIEGNYEKYYDLLISNNVIDSNYNWTFGNGQLVLVGDLVDRGNYVTQCLWLTYHLEKEATKHGGKVHYLLGNHEQLILLGFDDYCAPKYQEVFKQLNTNVSQVFSKQTELGRWIRSKNTIVKIGDYLFVHAGIKPNIVDYNMSLEKINSEIKRDIDTSEFETKESYELLSSDGVLWYRGFVEDDDNGEYKKISQQEVDKIIDYFGCKAIVIGHTPVDSISKDFNGKIMRLDVDHYENSRAFYVEENKEYMVDDKGNKKPI